MSFSAECPFCNTLLRNVPGQYAGQSMKCPRCRSYFTLSPLLGPPGRNKAIAAVETAPALAGAGQAQADAPPVADIDLQAAENPVPDPPIQEAVADEVVSPAAEPIAPAVSRPKKSVNYAAVLSFLFGSLAILALSLPFAGGSIMPLSSMGVLCGVLGFFWAAWRPVGVRLASLGLAVSVPALLIGSFWQAGPQAAPKLVSLPATSPPLVVHLAQRTGRTLVPREGDWADASKDAAQQGDVRVRVTTAEIRRLELSNPKRPRLSPEKWLVVRLRVSNAGTSRIIDYTGWGVLRPDTEATARLTDPQGKAYQPRFLGANAKLLGQVQQAAFAPGKWVEDALVFEAPPADVKFVRLELPCNACGGTGILNLEIPRRMIAFR